MKHLFAVVLGAGIWLAPAAAWACGCCDHPDHHAGAQASQPAAALAAGEARIAIPVAGMHCGHCASRVEAAVQKLNGVKTTSVQLHDGRVIVVFEKAKLTPTRIVETIDALGFKAGTPAEG